MKNIISFFEKYYKNNYIMVLNIISFITIIFFISITYFSVYAINNNKTDKSTKQIISGGYNVSYQSNPIHQEFQNAIFPIPSQFSQHVQSTTDIATPSPTIEPTPSPEPSEIIQPSETPTYIPPPKPKEITPSKQNLKKKVLGFALSSSYPSIVQNKFYLDEIATATHQTDEFGEFKGEAPITQINYANKNNIKPLLLFTNQFNKTTSKNLLENQMNRINCINNLFFELQKGKYKGINIDFEGIYPENRDDFSSFVAQIYSFLKPYGYTITIAVPAKTKDNPNDGWHGAFDYKALGNYVDEFILMTYDEHYSGGPPGPIASIEWVRKVVKYTQSVVSKEKIYLGIASYGYDWIVNEKTKAKALSMIKCNELSISTNSTIKWDELAKTPYFEYSIDDKNHIVWFENSKSLSYKLDLVNEFDIAGIAIWRLGLETEDFFNVISQKLK